MEALVTGRRIKFLTCVDDFTKECLTVTVAFGIPGVQVTRILDCIALFRGYSYEMMLVIAVLRRNRRNFRPVIFSDLLERG